LAQAGLDRLDLGHLVTEVLPTNVMLPAPGQGALAVQCRADWDDVHLIAAIDHLPSRMAVVAERAFLQGLGGGCATPVAAYGLWNGTSIALQGRVQSVDGRQTIDVQTTGECANEAVAIRIGTELAAAALDQGAGRLLGVTT
jgi:hydroxymethylbilane synthase